MLKTTSLVTAVPYSLELYSRARDIAAETFSPIPMLLVAAAWYLVLTSVLWSGSTTWSAASPAASAAAPPPDAPADRSARTLDGVPA